MAKVDAPATSLDSSETLACYGVGSESRGRKQASPAKPL